MKSAVDRLCDLFADKTELCEWRGRTGSVRYGGGRTRLAEAIGIDVSLVSRWNGTDKRGNHGKIPPKYNQAIVEACDRRGIPRGLLIGILEANCPTCGKPLETGQYVEAR